MDFSKISHGILRSKTIFWGMKAST